MASGILGRAFQFVRQARTMFLTCTLVPVALGGALAYDHLGRFDWALFLLTLLGVLVAHWGVNLANDYHDFRSGADRVRDEERPFSGGGSAITRDGVDPERVKLWFWCCFAFALGVGVSILFLIPKGRFLVLLLMLAGFAGGYYYTAPPLRLAYRGLGELDIFLCLGPAPVLGAFAVLTGTLTAKVWIASLPVAGLIAALLWINEYTDYESDKAAGKGNLVVRLGPKNARWGFLFLNVFIFGVAVLAVWKDVLSPWFLLTLLPLPLAARSVARALRSWNDTAQIKRAQGEFLLVHLTAGLLSALGVALGAP